MYNYAHQLMSPATLLVAECMQNIARAIEDSLQATAKLKAKHYNMLRDHWKSSMRSEDHKMMLLAP